MIITVSKPLSEILGNLSRYRKIFVVGCSSCATKCQTGSEEAVKRAIVEFEKAGKEIAGYAVLDTPCDMRIAKKDLAKLPAAQEAEALVIMACGAGVQGVEKAFDAKPLVPALNPVFVGTTERIGLFQEYCSVCGQCRLNETGGICPTTRCAKSLVNGPCGGFVDGKCEVDNTRDCAWVLIYEKLKKLGRQDELLDKFVNPRKVQKPRQVNNRPAGGR